MGLDFRAFGFRVLVALGSRFQVLCGSETMRDIYAIWFGAYTRKFEKKNVWF